MNCCVSVNAEDTQERWMSFITAFLACNTVDTNNTINKVITTFFNPDMIKPSDKLKATLYKN